MSAQAFPEYMPNANKLMNNIIPQSILDAFVAAARSVLADNLVGVYLHGSAAMGCYHPAVSDLDFIVVVRGPLSDEARRALMDAIVDLDSRTPGKGIEMSVVTAGACKPFHYPTPFELHYSRMHTAWYRRDPADYIEKMRGTDADLAAHFTVLRSRGACLCGAPIDGVFGAVPGRDYVDSILGDVRGAEEEIAENPMYLILNLARVLAFLEAGTTLSKREGGEWALAHAPEYRPLVQAALGEYAGGARPDYDADLARRYARDMLRRINVIFSVLPAGYRNPD